MRTLRSILTLFTALLPLSLAAADDHDHKGPPLDHYVYVQMDTSQGAIIIELNHKFAPETVDNFVQYVRDGAYDGTVFHRVIDGFMIQGGGFEPDGSKRPTRVGVTNEWRNGLTNDLGTISMARLGGQPDSGTNQFFINVKDNPGLDRPQADGAAYAVFGEVVEGMDVVEAIKAVETENRQLPQGPIMQNWPSDDIVIERVRLLSEEDAESWNERRSADRERLEIIATQRRDRLQRELEELQEQERQRQAQASKAFEEDLEEAKTFIEEEMGLDSSLGALDEDTGIWVLPISEGEGATPTPMRTVRVHYTGWLVDGTKFDSSRDRGRPAEFPLSGVIRGWTLGVGKMNTGARHILVIPSELGYGRRGAGRTIPANATLIFDVELLEIK